MKSILKGEKNGILFLLFLGLLFVLWGRILIREISMEIHTKNLETLFSRIACVESFGWQVDPGSEVCENFRLPERFDDVYTNYNEFLKLSGFDLSAFRGKVISKYTYIITNPPQSNKDTFYALLLVYENQMIGGNVFSAAIDGQMLPLKKGNE